MTTIERAFVRPTRVLVVDDSSLVRLYYRGALEKAGFEVEQAMNGLEAMEKALGGRFDLLVVDINMIKSRDMRGFIALLMDLPSIAALKAIVQDYIETVQQ